ncbi:MAG TPA: M14 family metallocarboxypeptidase, partial [Bacteroidia bacterium]|nr:M14 family metallocarboxypeptidase [Bacteroidia bacterium]
TLRTLCESGGHPVIAIENPIAASGESGGLYLSAGVHGDECAPVWALLEWAESSPEILRTRPVVLFPCLNPVGLIENTRRDGLGTDLNRCFEDASHPVIGAWQTFLSGRRFDTAINLHEDYDASGIYLYELTRQESRGEALLAACESLIPREPAPTIDGSPFTKGLLVRTEHVEQVVEEQLGGGYPEAIFLFFHHAATSHTFETPSELDLSRRIATHRAFLEAVACR